MASKSPRSSALSSRPSPTSIVSCAAIASAARRPFSPDHHAKSATRAGPNARRYSPASQARAAAGSGAAGSGSPASHASRARYREAFDVSEPDPMATTSPRSDSHDRKRADLDPVNGHPRPQLLRRARFGRSLEDRVAHGRLLLGCDVGAAQHPGEALDGNGRRRGDERGRGSWPRRSPTSASRASASSRATSSSARIAAGVADGARTWIESGPLGFAPYTPTTAVIASSADPAEPSRRWRRNEKAVVRGSNTTT